LPSCASQVCWYDFSICYFHGMRLAHRGCR
jgi:hypothetical protein